MLARLVASTGPAAVVDLETTGLVEDPEAEILEFGAVWVDPGVASVTTLHTLLRPTRPLNRAIRRLTGIGDDELAGAHPLEAVAPALGRALEGRVLIAHNAPFERYFLTRFVDGDLAAARFLDTLDLLAMTHPDAPDLRLESFTRALLGSEERHRALDDALDTVRVLSRVGAGADADEARYAAARRALETYAPESAWLALLGKRAAAPAGEPRPAYVAIGETDEPPVPFDEEAIAAALSDEARGRRHFAGYRVREAQIELARHFARCLRDGGVLLLEGGTGIGKSLAYLAAAIPFVMERCGGSEASPLIISTRTKLLQDQLLGHDVAAAARMLGHPGLRALSIKGRANYACARRLERTLLEGREPRLFAEDRMAFAALYACAHIRPHGEVGSVAPALLRRFPVLRGLLQRSVAARAELCTREQCAAHPSCPFGRRRAALAEAHLVIANHDLLLRWPPDYPAFSRAVVDEVHELADVADEVYALEVRPEQLLERLDEIFGRPGERGGALLPSRARRAAERDARAWRRELHADLAALGRALGDLAGEFGEVQVPEPAGPRFAAAAECARVASERLEVVADAVDRLAPRDGDERALALDRAAGELRDASRGLRMAFAEPSADAVAAFERIQPPFDRWRLMVRPVSSADAFHEHFLSPLDAFCGVSASLFVGGDAFAALGVLEIEERAGDRLVRASLPSPFPYAEHMRVVALEEAGDLVEATAWVLGELGTRLGGRTLGLFTSLRRMHQVADLLAERLRPEALEVLAPRRALDDPSALVERFRRTGGAVLLGARTFWQGLDIPGGELQALVIEKLPFEVPTELRRRREVRLRAAGVNAFERDTLGKMLLYLKQMIGRLIRNEADRGVVVIVEGRTERPYFGRLCEALPAGVSLRVARPESVGQLLAEVGIEGS